MDQDPLVTSLEKVATELAQKEGPLALFMLLAPDAETTDRWNLIVSAHGFDRKSRGNAIRQVSELVRERVPESEWPRIARVTVLRTDEPFVRAMNNAVESENKVAYMQSCSVFGVEIPQAVLFQSRRVAA